MNDNKVSNRFKSLNNLSKELSKFSSWFQFYFQVKFNRKYL